MKNGNTVEKWKSKQLNRENRVVLHAAVGIKQLPLTAEHIQNKLPGELSFASVSGMQCVRRMERRQRLLLTS